MNNINLVGGLVRDAELKFLPKGTALLNFSIGVSEYLGKDKGDYSNYFDCSMFGKRAESLHPYMGKGQKIAVEGLLHQDRWEKEGKNFSRVVIKVHNIDLVGAKKAAAAQDKSFDAAGAFHGNQKKDEFEDDIPF